jgi:hypothetical protein
MATPAAPAIPDIVREHLEELGFLSLTRRKLIVDWETDLSELAEHDERIAAHRDALHVAGAVAVEHARECLQDPLSAWTTLATGQKSREVSPSPLIVARSPARSVRIQRGITAAYGPSGSWRGPSTLK